MPIRSIRATRRISLGIIQRLKKWVWYSMVWWYKTTQKITGTRMANFNSNLLLRQNHQKSQWQLACFFGVFSNTCGHISQLPGSDFTSLFFIRSCVSSLLRTGCCKAAVTAATCFRAKFCFGLASTDMSWWEEVNQSRVVLSINSNDRTVGLLPLLWCTHTKWKAVNSIPQNVGAH